MNATTEVQTKHRRVLTIAEALSDEERRLYNRIPSEIDCMEHPSFSRPDLEEELFGEDQREVEVPPWIHFPEIPEEVPVVRQRRRALSAEDEGVLFLRYNYARYRLSALLAAQQKHSSVARAKEMVLWYQRALQAKASIARANMALVLAMAKRTRIPNVEFGELLSEGNMALLRSIEKFDVSRGFKFSTYGCRAILKSFNRLATKTGRYRRQFPIEFDPDLERSDYDVRRHEMERESSIDTVRDVLARNRADLTEMEKTIVMARFAIGSEGKGKTLAEVGKMVGLTNERVRQIQNLAIRKLRSVLQQDRTR